MSFESLTDLHRNFAALDGRGDVTVAASKTTKTTTTKKTTKV